VFILAISPALQNVDAASGYVKFSGSYNYRYDKYAGPASGSLQYSEKISFNGEMTYPTDVGAQFIGKGSGKITAEKTMWNKWTGNCWTKKTFDLNFKISGVGIKKANSITYKITNVSPHSLQLDRMQCEYGNSQTAGSNSIPNPLSIGYGVFSASTLKRTSSLGTYGTITTQIVSSSDNPTLKPKLKLFTPFAFDIDILKSSKFITVNQGGIKVAEFVVKTIRGEPMAIKLTKPYFLLGDIKVKFKGPDVMTPRQSGLPPLLQFVSIETTCNTKPGSYIISIGGSPASTKSFVSSVDTINLVVKENPKWCGKTLDLSKFTPPEITQSVSKYLKTDKSSYLDGERITVTGSIGKRIQDQKLSIKIFGPDGNHKGSSPLIKPSQSGTFSFTFSNNPISPFNSFALDGTYKAKVTYYFTNLETSFTVGDTSSTKPITSQPTKPLSFTTDKSSYERGDVISIQGNVGKIIPGQTVFVKILGEDEWFLASYPMEPRADGSFSTVIQPFVDETEVYIVGGTYKVLVVYGFQSSEKYIKLDDSSSTVIHESAADQVAEYSQNGVDLFNQGNIEEAIEFFEKALEISPSNDIIKGNLAYVFNEIAISHYTEGNYDNAIKNYKKALEFTPNDKTIKTNLDDAIKEKGSFEIPDDLHDALSSISVKTPSQIAKAVNVAVQYCDSVEFQQNKIECFKIANEKLPNEPKILGKLVVAYIDSKNNASTRIPSSTFAGVPPAILYKVAQVMIIQGQSEVSIDILTTILELNTDDNVSRKTLSTLESLCAKGYTKACKITGDEPPLNKIITPKINTPSSDIQKSANSIKEKVPSWVKNNAKWWTQGTIGDSDFVGGLQYLIKEDIIKVPRQTVASTAASNEIPSWVKTQTEWWANGQISENEFLNSIQYLMKHGIINIEDARSETGTQTASTPSETIPRITSEISFGIDSSTPYEIVNGQIDEVTVYQDDNTVGFLIDAYGNGELIITLPRDIIDAKYSDGQDSQFYVLIGFEERDFEEINTTDTERTLKIKFTKDDRFIEIIG